MKEEDYWEFLGKLQGDWKGKVTGKPGNGISTYFFFKTLTHFFHVVSKTEFPPQKNNPDGEIHEDEGYFSYDRNNDRGVLRMFYNEGYVTTFNLTKFDKIAQFMIFESISNENLPKSFRAKLTLTLNDINALDEKFELAPDGKDYKICIINRLVRT